MDGSPKPPQLVNKGTIDEKKATNEVKSQQQLGTQPSREKIHKESDRNITKGKHLNKPSSGVEVKNKPSSGVEVPAEAKQGLKSKLKSSVNPVHVGNTEGIVTGVEVCKAWYWVHPGIEGMWECLHTCVHPQLWPIRDRLLIPVIYFDMQVSGRLNSPGHNWGHWDKNSAVLKTPLPVVK